MRTTVKSSFVFVWLAFISALTLGQEFNTALMESTFRIVGTAKADPVTKQPRTTTGTAFFVGRPEKNDAKVAKIVLVTAGHVIDEIVGENALLILRKKNADGTYAKVPHQIRIRDGDKPLFARHPSADVVAMYLSIPSDIKLTVVPTSMLADDSVFEKYEIHPGDELLSLGYPFGIEANEGGFPILRSGKTASYPLVPARTVKYYLFDFHVFGGNSGGPVYFSYANRLYGNTVHIGETANYVAGLVSLQANSPPETGNQRLDLAIIVPAQYILETVNMLP